MTNHNLQGNWKQLKGKVKAQWGKLTDDEIDKIEGNRDQLVGALQTKYGKARAEVEEEVAKFFDRLAN